MAVASLVIGIIAAICGFIPCINYFAIIPAIVGLVLGFVGRSQAKKNGEPTGMATAGIVLNIVALALIIIWSLLFAAADAALPDAADLLQNM